MTVLAAMSTKELWSRLWDLLIQRMALDTTKEEWEKLTEQTNKIDAELKRRGELLSQEAQIMELLTSKEMMTRLKISRSTLMRRTRDCEHSPYKKAVIHDGARRLYYRPELWDKFMEYRNDKHYEEVYGIESIRDRSVI